MKAQQSGFTLAEVTIAGVILALGLITMLQLIQTTFETTDPNDPMAAQNNPVIEQYMRAQVAKLKSYRSNVLSPLASMPLGTGSLYPTLASTPAVVPAAPGALPGNGAEQYALAEFEVKIQMTMATDQAQRPATDPVLAHTRFWKLGISNGSFKTGL